jgi:trigger factor
MQQAVDVKPSALERQVRVAVPASQLETDIAERLKKLARTVKMQGFRPGKVPMKMVERQFGFQVRQEALSDAVQGAFAREIEAQNLRVAGMPRFEPVPAGGGESASFEFQAVFEVYPEVAMKDILSVPVTRPVTEVSEAEVDKTIDTLRRQRAPFEAVSRASADRDRVDIDFEGTLDGAPFEGGSGKNFAVILGERRMLPAFEAALVGLSAGESKTFPLTFPDDYADHLKGKTAQFAIPVNQVLEPRLPAVDAEFARSLGVADGDVEQMRREIRDNVEREVKKRVEAAVKQQVMDGLVGAADFEVPRSLVDSEVGRMRQAAMQDLKARGLTTDNVELPADLFAERAANRVKLGLLVGDLVRRHDLRAKPEQVRAVIEEHAESYEQPEEMARWLYGQPERLAEVEAVVMENNVVQWALGQMKVADTPTPFDELMGTRKD